MNQTSTTASKPWFSFFIFFSLVYLIPEEALSQSLTKKEHKQVVKDSVVQSREFEALKSFIVSKERPDPDNIVHPNTFNDVVKRDVEFTILGDGSTVSGSQIDVSSKTSAKITFRIPSKSGVITGELEGAQKDQDIPIFNGGKYKGEITGKVNFNIIPPINVYDIQNGVSAALRPVFANLKTSYDRDMIDSARVMGILIKYFPGGLNYDLFIALPTVKIALADQRLTAHYEKETFISAAHAVANPEYTESEEFRVKLAIGIAKKYLPEANFDSVSTYEDFEFTASMGPYTHTAKLVDDFRKILIRLGKRDELLEIDEIQQASPYWTAKRLTWFTITPGITYKSYSMFGRGSDSLVLIDKTTPFITPRVSGWLSHYNIFKDVATLIRGGIEFVYANNLKDFTEVKYYERDTLQIEQKGNVVISETVTDGLFRKFNSQQEQKLFVNLYFEYYRLPKKDFVPGLVVKGSFMKEGILAKNRRKLRPEIGMVLNLYNKEKKNAYLTVQPYIRYDNLLRETKIVNDSVETVTVREKLGFGILIGLPIRGRMFTGED